MAIHLPGARAQNPGPAPVARDAQVDRILAALQQRSDDLRDIRCEVRFEEDDHLNLTKREKYGRLLFAMTEPNPHFLVQFDRTVVGGVTGKREWYLFDGQWLYQAIERIAQVTRQEIAKPDEKLDLFNIEKAPFPLPFGQKKETILRNFDVSLMPPAPGDPPDTDHLMCKPKPGSRLTRRYEQLDLHVNRKLHLPTRIVVTKSQGLEINTADFPDLSEKSINTGIKPTDFARPPEWKSFKEVVEEIVPGQNDR